MSILFEILDILISHLFDGVLVDQVVVVLIECAVEGDAVWLEEQVLQRVHSLETQALLNPIRQVGVIEDHVEPKGLRPQGHRRPNSSWTERY